MSDPYDYDVPYGFTVESVTLRCETCHALVPIQFGIEHEEWHEDQKRTTLKLAKAIDGKRNRKPKREPETWPASNGQDAVFPPPVRFDPEAFKRSRNPEFYAWIERPLTVTDPPPAPPEMI